MTQKKQYKKKKMLSRSVTPSPSPTLEEKKETGPGRPQGSVGLRKSLYFRYCSDNPSPIQESIVNALVKIDTYKSQKVFLSGI